MQKKAPNGATLNFPDSMTEEQVNKVLERKFGAGVIKPSIDETSGAPLSVRALAGPQSRKEQDRLAAIRRYYPDAQPYGDGNFLYTDPRTGRPTLANPAGFDVGDLAEYSRIAPEMVGAGVGAAAGAAASTPTGWTGAPVMVPLGAGLGGAAGGALYDAAMQYLAGRPDTRTIGQRGLEAGTDVLANAAGQSVGDLAQRFIRMPGAAQRLQDFRQAGVPIQGAAGPISGSIPIKKLEEAVRFTPTGSKTMVDAIDQTVGGVEQQARNIANRIGDPGTKAAVGERISGAVADAGQRFASRQQVLMDDVMRAVGETTPVPINNITSLNAEFVAAAAKAPKSSRAYLPAIERTQALIDDAGDVGSIEYGALREVLTDIGQALEQPSSVTGYVGGAKGKMRRVYGAIKQDLDELAESVGAKSQVAAQRRYVKWAQPGLKQAEALLKQNPDTLYNWLLSGSKDGYRRLLMVRRTVDKPSWDNLSATVVEKLGKSLPNNQNAEGEAFSIYRFVTNWNNVSTEARKVLFDSEQRNAIQRLVRVASHLKEAEKVANTSRTALSSPYVQAMTGGAIGYFEPSALLLSHALPYVTAKTLTNPRFVQWLANTSTTKSINGIGAQMNRLAAIAGTEVYIKPEMKRLYRQLETVYEQIKE